MTFYKRISDMIRQRIFRTKHSASANSLDIGSFQAGVEYTFGVAANLVPVYSEPLSDSLKHVNEHTSKSETKLFQTSTTGQSEIIKQRAKEFVINFFGRESSYWEDFNFSKLEHTSESFLDLARAFYVLRDMSSSGEATWMAAVVALKKRAAECGVDLDVCAHTHLNRFFKFCVPPIGSEYRFVAAWTMANNCHTRAHYENAMLPKWVFEAIEEIGGTFISEVGKCHVNEEREDKQTKKKDTLVELKKALEKYKMKQL